jgi:hypothetical protein
MCLYKWLGQISVQTEWEKSGDNYTLYKKWDITQWNVELYIYFTVH